MQCQPVCSSFVQKDAMLNKPPRLRRGSTIALTAPASPVRDRSALQRGIEYLQSLGYRVVLGRTLSEATSYLAGSDELRAEELNRFFADPSIDAIFCVRGGYGTLRVLELLDWELIAAHPKVFVGFSDTTALQWALFARAQLPSISGILVGSDFADVSTDRHAQLWALVTDTTPPRLLWQGSTENILRRGTAEGVLLAGTLTLVASLCGTPFMPPLDGALVALEDVSEEPYRIDRMLRQLYLTGHLQKCAALLFGAFMYDEQRHSALPTRPIEEIAGEYVELSSACAAVVGIPYGHIRERLILPIGLRACLDAEHAELWLLEPLVQ